MTGRMLAAALAALLATEARAQTGTTPIGIEQGDYLEGRVTTISSDAIHGHTVFQISVMPLDPAHPITNVYAIYGDGDHQLLTPPAFHVPAPFGCDIGGTNPAFWEINADSQWDSWLTVGVTEGNVRNEISSIGVDWSAWTQDKGMSIDDGAIFWMDPDDAPKFSEATSPGPDQPAGIVLGQLTILTGTRAHVKLSAQGRTQPGMEDWEEIDLQFSFFGPPPPPHHPAHPLSPPPTPARHPPPPPPPPPGRDEGCDPFPTTNGMRVTYRRAAGGHDTDPMCPGQNYPPQEWGCPEVRNGQCGFSRPAGNWHPGQAWTPGGEFATGGACDGMGDGPCDCDPCPACPNYHHSTKPYTTSTIAMVRCSAPLQMVTRQTSHHIAVGQPPSEPVRRVLSFGEARCLPSGQWTDLNANCERDEAPPPPPVRPPPPPTPQRPPPPPAHSTPSCDVNSLQPTFARINEVCCHDEGLACDNGPPTHCSQSCKEVVTDFWARCETLMSQMPLGFTQLDEFVEVCNRDDGGDISSATKEALSSLKTADGPGMDHPMQFACTYTELTGLALQCSTVSAPTTDANTAAFCASRCATQLLPFAQQCSATMQTALTTFGLQDTFVKMVGACNPALDDRHVCPIDTIMKTCANLANPSGDATALCATPCVEQVTAHFNACSKSTDPNIQAVFSADNWRPLVELCRSTMDSGDNAGLGTQCDNIQGAMQTQLSNLCCADAACTIVPNFCPTACKDALMPYFRDCASELLASDPAFMGRLTSLARVCTSQGH